MAEIRKDDAKGPYRFQRKTERALDTMTNDGWGNPVKPVGLIASSFRPRMTLRLSSSSFLPTSSPSLPCAKLPKF